MSERMLKVEAEIALIDDKIAELREEEAGKGGKVEAPKDGMKGGEAQGSAAVGEKPREGSWWQ